MKKKCNVYLINHLYTSLPLANNNKAINNRNPVIWAYSKNLSLGFLPVTISYNKNITWPPSKAGMGKMFIKAKIMESRAVVLQKAAQFQVSGNKPPIAANPPTPLYAPV